MEQLDPYIGENRTIFRPPNERAGYFLGSYAVWWEAYTGNGNSAPATFFAPVIAHKISAPSRHILAGEAPLWPHNDDDRDDYTQDAAFRQQTLTEPVTLLFADGHTGQFTEFDPHRMTVRYKGTGGYEWP